MPWKTSLARLAALGAFAVLGAQTAAAAPCTDGVDCYCDCVKGANRGDGFASAQCAAKNVRTDASLLMCEDFEAPNLTQDVGRGVTNGNYGPWYDDTGYAGNRGNNSYWSKNYGPANQSCSMTRSDPRPSQGAACNFPTCMSGEWSAGDRWGGNTGACIDIMRNGEFDDEVSTNREPTIPGGGAGVIDGNAIMANRVGRGSVAGIHGSKSFRAVSTIGITGAVAFPADILSSQVWNSPWKDNEFGSAMEHWHRGATGIGTQDDLPYMPFRFAVGSCAAATANAVAHVGVVGCNSAAIIAGPGNAYSQPTDFPFGTWGCSQAYMSGMNTGNMTWKVWHNGKLIIHISGIDGRRLQQQSIDVFKFNNYANHNQFAGQSTTRTTYRYEDNIHVREGEPVSCQQIGFTSLTPPPPPPTTPPPAPSLGKPGTPVFEP